MTDALLLPGRLAALLGTCWLARSLEIHESVGSTNDLALERLAAGAPHGHLVVAGHQSAGRGQRGKSWNSPAGLAVSATLVLRSRRSLAGVPLLVAAAGLGIAEGLERGAGVAAGLKWPNDVWIGERKVAGVLAEARGAAADQPALVVGFGVNVNQAPADLAGEIRDIATSLRIATGRVHDRAEVLAAVLAALEPRLDEALAGTAAADLHRAYRERSVLLGRQVSLLDGAAPVHGVVEDVSASKGLLLRTDGGFPRHVRAEHAREVRPVRLR